MKVWARMLTGRQEKKAAKRNRGGEEKRWVGSTQQVGTEPLPMSASQATLFTMWLSASPSLWAVGGQGQGSLGFLACSN